MKFASMRNAIVIASVIVGSVIPSQAFAQIDVLTGFQTVGTWTNGLSAQYRFTDSMILNSIGFVTNGATPTSLSYSINGTTYSLGTAFTLEQLSSAENGIQWLNLTPLSMVNNDVVTINTLGAVHPITNKNQTYYFGGFTLPSSNLNVSYEGTVALPSTDSRTTQFTNSNIRVSNPGSNVAPEPGSFALALTGGAALLGICIRRRRNAA